MPFSFWSIFRSRADPVEVRAQDLFADQMREVQMRELALSACVNMIAAAVGRCDFRTYERWKEVRDALSYRWNVEPNGNQNSTAFLHKLVYMLCAHNEALIVDVKRRDGRTDLVIADSWNVEPYNPNRQNRYKSVRVGEYTFDRSFYEPDVLHLALNHLNVEPVLSGLFTAYKKLLAVAVSAYEYTGGQHWKVNIDRVRTGRDQTEAELGKMIAEDMKTFLSSSVSVLPEYKGMTYADVSRQGSGKDQLADVRTLFEDIFNATARAYLIPISLIGGKVEGTKDATQRFLSECIDPICDQLQEEINRKTYGYEKWSAGTFMQVDSSAISHFDLFENAASVEKLIGSGAYSINEVRRAANQPRINEPWADEHYMTLNNASVLSQTRALSGKGEKNAET